MSLLGIDIGTTGCKAATFSVDGRIIAQAAREYATHHPRADYAELDSREVWQKIRDVLGEVAAHSRHDPVTALSVSSLGEAVVPVSRNRDILGSSILCFDSRGGEEVRALEALYSQAWLIPTQEPHLSMFSQPNTMQPAGMNCGLKKVRQNTPIAGLI